MITELRRRNLFQSKSGGSGPVVGGDNNPDIPEIVLYDTTNNKQVIIPYPNYNLSTYPKTRYTPVGVVVIPAWVTNIIFNPDIVYAVSPLGLRDHDQGLPIMMSLTYLDNNYKLNTNANNYYIFGMAAVSNVTTSINTTTYYNSGGYTSSFYNCPMGPIAAFPYNYTGDEIINSVTNDSSIIIDYVTATWSALNTYNRPTYSCCNENAVRLYETDTGFVLTDYQITHRIGHDPMTTAVSGFKEYTGSNTASSQRPIPFSPYIYSESEKKYYTNPLYFNICPSMFIDSPILAAHFNKDINDNIPTCTSNGIAGKGFYLDAHVTGDFDGPYHSQMHGTSKSPLNNTATPKAIWDALKTAGTTGNTNSDLRGDYWYIPAMGELGMLAARFEKFNLALEHIQNTYGSGIVVQKLIDRKFKYDNCNESSNIKFYNDISQITSNEVVALYTGVLSSSPGPMQYAQWGQSAGPLCSLHPDTGYWFPGGINTINSLNVYVPKPAISVHSVFVIM